MKSSSKGESNPPSGLILRRSKTNRVLAGVCGGIGEYLGIDPTIIRIIFIIITVFGGSGIIIYLILWLVIPSSDSKNSFSVDALKTEIKGRIQDLKESSEFRDRQHSRFWWGLLLLVVGVLILFNNLGLLDQVDLIKYWPLLLIVMSFLIIFGGR